MKMIMAGGFMLLGGILLYAAAHLAAAHELANIHSWSTPPGKFGTALRETGGLAASRIGIVLGAIGFTLLVWETLLAAWLVPALGKMRAEVARRNEEFDREFGK